MPDAILRRGIEMIRDAGKRNNRTLHKQHSAAICRVKRADEIIRNTYRTLLTRGMKGCYIYCTDPGMREYIRKRLDLVSKREAFVRSM